MEEAHGSGDAAAAALQAKCRSLCPAKASIIDKLAHSAGSVCGDEQRRAIWLRIVRDQLHTNPLLALAASAPTRGILLATAAAALTPSAPVPLAAAASEVLATLLVTAPLAAAKAIKSISSQSIVAAHSTTQLRGEDGSTARSYTLAVLSSLISLDHGGSDDGKDCGQQNLLPPLLSQCTNVADISPPAEQAEVASRFADAALVLFTLTNTGARGAQVLAGRCGEVLTAVGTVMEGTTPLRCAELVSALASVLCILSAAADPHEQTRATALLGEVLGESGVSAGGQQQQQQQHDKGTDVASHEPATTPAACDAACTTLCAELLQPVDVAPREGRPTLVRLQEATVSLQSALGQGSRSRAVVQKGHIRPVLRVLEQLDERFGAVGILCAVMLTPGLASCLCALLRTCPDAAKVPSDDAAAVGEGTGDDAPIGAGDVFDLWMAVLQAPSNLARARSDGFPAASAVRCLLLDAFLLLGGAEKLVACLGERSDLASRTAPLAPAEVALDEDEGKGQLLGAWHLLEVAATASAVPCARLLFSAEALPRAIGPVLLSAIADEKSAGSPPLLSVPLHAEVLSTALGLIPAMVTACQSCVDDPSPEETRDGATPLSHATQKICGADGEALVSTVATLVSTGALVGNADVVTAGLDALVVLAGAFPYAATRVVDFDFLSESMELWKVSAAEAEPTPPAEAGDAVDLVAQGIVAGTRTKEEEKKRSAAFTIRDALTVGTLRVMEAMVRRVPHAVNFEWIELLKTGIALLPYHRASARGDSAAVSLREVFAPALLRCVLSSVRANEEAADYLFEAEEQDVLWGELQARYAEVKDTAPEERELGDVVVSLVLLLAAHFPPPRLTAEVCTVLETLLPSQEGSWNGAATPCALAAYLDAATALPDTEAEQRHDKDEESSEAGVEAFVARAVCATLPPTAPHSSSSSSSGITDSDTRQHLVNALRNCGPLAILRVLRSVSPGPSDEDVPPMLSRLLALSLALRSRDVGGRGADGSPLGTLLWDAAVNLTVGMLDWLTGTPLPADIAAAGHDAYARVLYCQHGVALLETVAAVPAVSTTHVLPTLLAQRGDGAETPGRRRPFLSSLAHLRDRTRRVASAQPPTAAAASLLTSLDQDLSLVATGMLQAVSATDNGVKNILDSPGWHEYATVALLPSVLSSGGSDSPLKSFLVLLNIPEVRHWLSQHDREAYRAALVVVEDATRHTPYELACQLYKTELDTQ